MDGFLIVDKPAGITSHDVIRAVRRILQIRRVGHIGTLDPLATGVLPVAVGSATRLVEFFSEDDKIYLATMQFGAFTDTEDAEGEIIATRPYEGLDKEIVARKTREFLGEIEQIPPMYSAVKVQGQPLYKLARKGIEIERRPRQVRIDSFEVRNFELPLVTFEVACSKGTYVRTLCRSLAEALGTAGHLVALRRIRSGRFSLTEARPLEEIMKTVSGEKPPGFLSMEEGMKGFSACEVSSAAADRLLNGIPPAVSDLEEKPDCGEGDIVVLGKNHRLLAVTRFAPQRKKEKRGDFEILKVFNRR